MFYVCIILSNKIFIFDEYLVVFGKHSNKTQKKHKKRALMTRSILRDSHDRTELFNLI